MPKSLPDGVTLQDAIDAHGTIMVAFAGLTVLVWDHIVTFDDEVKLIWNREKGLAAYLFLINRYLTPLGFIVNLVAYILPSWGSVTFGTQLCLWLPTHHAHSCQHFVQYEGAMTAVGTQIAGFIMFLRVRAIYDKRKTVVWSLMALFLIWLGVNAWLITRGQPVSLIYLPPCTMIFSTSNAAASASAWLPLLFDTCIFVLTLYKTKCRTGHIIQTLWSDGILYYSVICVVNVVLTVMIVLAGTGVKNIAAQLELLLTVAMVSRITLNLRKQSSKDIIVPRFDDWTPLRPRRTTRTGSGSTGMPWTRSLTVGSASTSMPRRNSIAFCSEPVSYPEQLRLNTVYSASAAMTPAAASFVSEEGPRFYRPDVE